MSYIPATSSSCPSSGQYKDRLEHLISENIANIQKAHQMFFQVVQNQTAMYKKREQNTLTATKSLPDPLVDLPLPYTSKIEQALHSLEKINTAIVQTFSPEEIATTIENTHVINSLAKRIEELTQETSLLEKRYLAAKGGWDTLADLKAPLKKI